MCASTPLPPARGVAARAASRPVRAAVDGSAQIEVPPDRPATVLAVALGLAVVHLLAVRATFNGDEPRRRVVSLGAGVSIAYVFVHVLPEVGRADRVIREFGATTGVVDRHAYLVALAGFVAAYGLERFVQCSWKAGGRVDRIAGRWFGPSADRERAGGWHAADGPAAGVFWIHLGSFAAYDGLIGYLLVHRARPGPASLAAYAVAIGLHFLVIDAGMRGRYPRRYHDVGRWVLAGAVLLGAVLGVATVVRAPVVDALFAFLAGSVVLNAVNEELPEKTRSDFWAFVGGAAAYALLLTAA